MNQLELLSLHSRQCPASRNVRSITKTPLSGWLLQTGDHTSLFNSWELPLEQSVNSDVEKALLPDSRPRAELTEKYEAPVMTYNGKRWVGKICKEHLWLLIWNQVSAKRKERVASSDLTFLRVRTRTMLMAVTPQALRKDNN